MTRTEIVQPDVTRMIEGLRDTGYEFVTAVADLIDNSIAAGASIIHISVDMDFEGQITLAISDNGYGMNYQELLDAMQYGSPPRPDRRSLGKFGMGLKTASTAFCRRLSVISRTKEERTARKATWDIDHVVRAREWEVLIDVPTGIEMEFMNSIADESSGTLVTWGKVDRLLKEYSDPGGHFARKALDRKVGELRDHASMVYQRFLDPADPREQQKVRITINGEEIYPWDPFCKEESELVAEEKIPVGHDDEDDVLGEFLVRAYVLPRQEEFSSEEAMQTAKLSNRNQGLYIYRENRLIHAADWLKMYSKEIHYSLLRVEFSFTADLDEAFDIDIKKSRILLNETLYRWLRGEFLPPARRAAESRHRKGTRKKTQEKSRSAHDRSNAAIRNKEPDIDQADIRVLDEKGNTEIKNPHGTTSLRLNLSSAYKPGEVFVRAADGIQDGLLWQPTLIDGHQGVQINSGHEFYRKVYLPNILSAKSESINIQGLDSLLWALSIAELRAVNESTKDHFDEMRFEISRILRKLVEHLPDPPETGDGRE